MIARRLVQLVPSNVQLVLEAGAGPATYERRPDTAAVDHGEGYGSRLARAQPLHSKVDGYSVRRHGVDLAARDGLTIERDPRILEGAEPDLSQWIGAQIVERRRLDVHVELAAGGRLNDANIWPSGALGQRDHDRHGCVVGRGDAIAGAVGERVEAGESSVRRVAKTAVCIQAHAALAGVGDDGGREQSGVRVDVVGEDAGSRNGEGG